MTCAHKIEYQLDNVAMWIVSTGEIVRNVGY